MMVSAIIVTTRKRVVRVYDAKRNKLIGDRRAGESPPAGIRSSAGLGHVVGDCLNVMAIRIEDESCIVILAVMWA